MNHVFRTNFKVLDAHKRRGQTTKGIWIVKANDIEPLTIVMDLEGTDSNERGEVAKVRQRFSHSISPGGLAGDRQEVEPASGFPVRVETIWKQIKDNKDLDLPAFKVMVAAVRCEEIVEEKFKLLTSDEKWLALKVAVQVGPVSGFGVGVSAILETYLSEYDMEVIYFDQDIRNAKRQQLESRVLVVVQDAYLSLLEHLCARALESFKARLEMSQDEGQGFLASSHPCAQSCMLEFDQGCDDAAVKQSEWNAVKVRRKLRSNMDGKICETTH